MAARKIARVACKDPELRQVQENILAVLEPVLAKLTADSSYCAAAYNSGGAAQALAGAQTTILQLNSRIFDTDGAVSPGAAWAFTVPPGKGGTYLVTAACEFSSAGAVDAFLYLTTNGTATRRGERVTSTGFRVATAVAIVALNDNDRVDARVFVSTGQTTSGLAVSNRIEIVRLGD